MPLKKGFLAKEIPLGLIGKWRIGWSLIVWLLFSFLFYAFLVCVREVWRLPIWNSAAEELLILSRQELNFYNFFLACLACIVSWGFVFNLLLKGIILPTSLFRFKKQTILNEQNVLSWYFLYWFSKLGIVFGIFSATISLSNFFNLYANYKIIFISSLVLLFLNQWITLRLVFKRDSFKAMLLAACLIVFVSFLFSRTNVIDSQKLDQAMMKNFVIYNYNVALPVINNTNGVYRYNAYSIYLGTTIGTIDPVPKIVVNDGAALRELDENSLLDYLELLQTDVDPFEVVTLVLQVDKNTGMRYVKNLMNIIGRADASFNTLSFNILFRTNSKEYGYHGLKGRAFRSCDVFDTLASEIKSGRNVALPLVVSVPWCVQLDSIDFKFQVLRISLINNNKFLNDEPINDDDLRLDLYTHVKKHGAVSLVELYVDDHSDYDHYLKLKSLIKESFDIRRDELVFSRYSKHLPLEEYDSQYSEIMHYLSEVCPVNVFELENEEKVLLDYIRRRRDN